MRGVVTIGAPQLHATSIMRAYAEWRQECGSKLHEACCDDNEQGVLQLLDLDADLRVQDAAGQMVLREAALDACVGHVCVELLVRPLSLTKC